MRDDLGQVFQEMQERRTAKVAIHNEEYKELSRKLEDLLGFLVDRDLAAKIEEVTANMEGITKASSYKMGLKDGAALREYLTS